MNKTIYTYDIWDTILKRYCLPSYTLEISLYWLLLYLGKPEKHKEVYEKIKAQESDFFNRKEEYFIESIIVRTLIDNDLMDGFSNKIVTDMWGQIYYFVEANCTYKNKEVIKLIESDYGDKLFISDFYTDSDFIKKLLHHHQVEVLDGVTSAEYGASKHAGSLYEKIELLKQRKWIHTGDNELADITMAKRAGADVRLIKSQKKKEVNKFKIKNDYERLAFIVLSFSLFILKTARKEKCNKIYFFTREGVFFKKIFDLLLSQIPNIVPSLTTEILPISRVASLALKFNESDDFLGFNDALTQYGYGVSTFLSFFHLDEYYSELTIKYHDVKELLSHRNDPLVKELIKSIDDKKKRTENFLASIEFDSEPSIIVDIGWRGSIQDNLMSRKSNRIRHGCYLGLFDFYPGQSSLNKSSVIFNNNEFNQKWTMKGVAFMETVFNALDGSVVDYVNNQPKRKENEVEMKNSKQLIVMQDAIVEEFMNLSLMLKEGKLNINDIEILAIESYKKIVTNPSQEIADFYVGSIQNESFGLNDFIYKEFNITVIDFFQSLISKRKRNEIRIKLHRNGWRESILKSSKVSLSAKLCSLLIR